MPPEQIKAIQQLGSWSYVKMHEHFINKFIIKNFKEEIVEKYLDVADINSPNLTSDSSKWVCTVELSKS